MRSYSRNPAGVDCRIVRSTPCSAPRVRDGVPHHRLAVSRAAGVPGSVATLYTPATSPPITTAAVETGSPSTYPTYAANSVPHRVALEYLAEPRQRHVETQRPDRAERVLRRRVADTPRRRSAAAAAPADAPAPPTIPGRSTECRRPCFSNVSARAAPRRRVDEILADPIGPLQPARVEVHHRQHDALRQFRVVRHRPGEERRIEHLERDARRGDAHALQFAQFARSAAAGDHPERLAQIVRHILERHRSPVCPSAGGVR